MLEAVAILLALLEKAAVIVTAAFLLSLVRPFQRVVVAHWSPRRTAALVLVFGTLSVSGSHLALEVLGSHPNVRAIGILVAGLIGGPWVGAAVGLAGAAWLCFVKQAGHPLWPYLLLASVVDGVLAGLVGRRRPINRLGPSAAAGFSVLIQVAHLAIVGLALLALRPDWLLGSAERFVGVGPEVLGNAAGVALFVLILRTALAASEREVALTRQEAAADRARLAALQAQIHPHFLYNALGTIAYLVRTQPEEARSLLGRLADLLRRTLRRDAGDVTLAEELETVESYLDIERARFGDRLRIEVEVEDAAREAAVPPLLLQPLVENAIQHGVSRRAEGGTVAITARREGPDLVVEVRDDGAGWDGSGRGVGLTNVADRLEVRPGARGRLEVEGGPGRGTMVRIVVPQPA